MKNLTKPDIEWRDLLVLTPRQVLFNCLLSLPFLLCSWIFAQQGWYVLALIMSFFFFTCALRQAHDCYHHSIGLNKTAVHILLYLLSITMLCSTHAIRYTHLQHHRDPLGENDVEGNWARLPMSKAIALGGLFSIHIQWQGFWHGDKRTRRHSLIDMLLINSVFVLAATWQTPWLVYHVLTMMVANMLVGFFAVWSVHHDCDDKAVFARTERQGWANFATVYLLYHMEHHLFARVPSNHLLELARRMDAIVPEWSRYRVLPVFRQPESCPLKNWLAKSF
ncbi:fatty acid desaturase family protein [Neisseriaceae bacterium B1]